MSFSRLILSARACLMRAISPNMPCILFKDRKPINPHRPVMPTESLGGAATTLDQFAQAAMAEIERREGYEVELRTALENCRKPISPRNPDGGTVQ